MTDEKQEPSVSNIKERLSVLETANKFHQESLDEISTTLKRVVETQAMLANQREELIKISDSLHNLTEKVNSHETTLQKYEMKIDHMADRMNTVDDEVEEISKQTQQNTRFVRIATYVVTSIMVPAGLAVFGAAMKYFFGI